MVTRMSGTYSSQNHRKENGGCKRLWGGQGDGKLFNGYSFSKMKRVLEIGCTTM